MLRKKFIDLANQIDEWGATNIPQGLKHNLTSALRIAADPQSNHTIDDVLSYALQGDRNKYSEHLERQLEPIGRSVKRYLANAAVNPDGVMEAWKKNYPLPKHLREPEPIHEPEEPFNPVAGLFNILNPDQSRNKNVSCRANRLLSEGVMRLKRESRPEKRSRLQVKRAIKAERAAALSA